MSNVIIDALKNYIDAPPSACNRCGFSIVEAILINAVDKEYRRQCFIDRVYCQMGEPVIVPEEQTGCSSEVFLKKLLEVL